MTVLLVYAPQADLDDSAKDLFYENLPWILTKINASQILFVSGYISSQKEECKCALSSWW